ncbi:MAG: BBP7 family outer membrane beta-barrel protein [Pirellulaceae bacterium]
MALATTRTTSRGTRRFLAMMAAVLGGLLLAASAAQAQPYGKAIAQPFFDFDNQARFMSCRPGPYMWGFDPYLQDEDCEEDCRGGIIAHRPSSWYAIADFTPLMYDANGNIELARLGATGPTVLTSTDLEHEFDAGARLTIGRTFGGGCYQVEGSYLGVYSWEDAATAVDSTANGLGGVGNLSSAFSNFNDPAVAGLDRNNRITATDYNSFKSAEINLRTWLNVPPGPFDVQLLVGARYMSAFENFGYTAISDRPLALGSQNSATVLTRNDMYGVQIGIDMDFLVSARFYYDFELKGGILHNFASQSTSYTSINSAGVASDFDTGASQDRTAFFGDLSLTGNWQMGPNWNLRFGYQAIFINGVALGPQNFQTNNALLQTGPGQLDDTGEVIYHGPVLGVMWTR